MERLFGLLLALWLGIAALVSFAFFILSWALVAFILWGVYHLLTSSGL